MDETNHDSGLAGGMADGPRDEQYRSSFVPAPGPSDARLREARRTLLRRLRILLMTGAAAFALTAWLLVRVENPASLLPWGQGPSRVVRQHLEALNRGEFRAAYDFFSAQYRAQIPFPAYERMLATHREMFRTSEVEIAAPRMTSEHAVLETRLSAADGEHYVARFTLVRRDGRWWIDAIRWLSAPSRRNLISV